MKYIVPNSTRGLVNKLADYIVSHLDPNKNNLSFVEVTCHNSFFVIVGKTERESLLDINEIKLSLSTISLLPIGSIIIYSGELIPKNWLKRLLYLKVFF